MIYKFAKILETITNRDIKILVIGLIVGCIICSIVQNLHGIKIILQKPTECILTTCISIVVFLQIFYPSIIQTVGSNILTFLSTMAFSWILTKYSAKNDYENKQKELASLSYKHSVGIKNKLEYTKNEIERYMKEMERCDGNEDGCKLKSKFENTKSQIIYVYQDAIDNLNDWASSISEEIKIFDELKDLDNKIEVIEDKIDELNSNKESTANAINKLNKLEKEKKKLLYSIDHKVFHAIKVSKDQNELYSQNAIKDKVNKLSRKSSETSMVNTGA